MANRYWVGGTASWDATAGTKWSLTSGGAGGQAVPTASDDVFFDAASGAVTVTVSASSVCRDLNFTGFTGTFAGSSPIAISSSLTLATGMTRTFTGVLTFNSTASGKTITMNGKTLASSITFNGVGGVWTLQDTANWTSGTVTLTNGTLDTNNVTLSFGAFSLGAGTKTLTLGSSTVNIASTWNANTNVANFTLNSGTSSIVVTPNGVVFEGGGKTYYNLNWSPTANNARLTFRQSNTFNNITATPSSVPKAVFISSAAGVTQTINVLTLTGFDATHRIQVESSTIGSTFTLSAATTSLTNVNFQDCIATGAAAWSGTSIGNALGNTGITFTSPTTRYWIGGTGNWDATTEWSTSSGGASGASVPLVHDTVIFDANSFTAGSQTVTVNMFWLGASISMVGVTNTPTFTFNTAGFEWGFYGDVTFVSGMNITAASNTNFVFYGRGSHTFTTANKTINPMNVKAPGGTLAISGDLTITGTNNLSLNNGTLDVNGGNVSIGGFNNAVSTTRGLYMGSGTWTLTGSGTCWNSATTTGLTFDAETSTIVINEATAAAKVFAGGGLTYYDVTFQGAGSGTLTVTGANTFHYLKGNSSALAKTIILPASTTTTVADLLAIGSSGKLVTIQSSSAGVAATLSCPSGLILCNWISLRDNTGTGGASFFAGANSTNVSGNTNWTFTSTPSNTRDARITGLTTDSSSRDARITGQVIDNDSRDARITGDSAPLAANDSRDARITGQVSDNNSRDSRITGQTTDNANRDARISGQTTGDDSRDARITGQVTSDDSRDARVTGQQSDSSNRDGRVTGQATDSANRDARITGSLSANDSIDARITGQATANDTRDSRITGQTTDSNSRDARISGKQSDQSDRDARVQGQVTIDDSRDVRIHGQVIGNDNRDAKVTGILFASDEISAKIQGKDTYDDSRDARIYGIETIGNDRSASITGRTGSDSERSAKLIGGKLPPFASDDQDWQDTNSTDWYTENGTNWETDISNEFL